MDEKCCKNCAHYMPHYVRKQTRFEPAACGHCTKNLQKRRFLPCAAWEADTEKIVQRRYAIEATLNNISRKIAEMAQILREDADLTEIGKNSLSTLAEWRDASDEDSED